MQVITLFRVELTSLTDWQIGFLEASGVVFADQEEQCDVFVSQRYHRLRPFMLRHGESKHYLVWTHEPRWNTDFEAIISGENGLPAAHVMNVYTGDVYVNNYLHFPIDAAPITSQGAAGLHRVSHRKIAALLGYRKDQSKWSIRHRGRELDLSYLRTVIASEGHRRGCVDIYGRGWPPGLALEDSSSGAWRLRKAAILANYDFALCFENTNVPYYCTEKIWDAIGAQCLPIYYGGGNAIYEDFPRNSFIDFHDMGSPDRLFEYIETMSEQEILRRKDLCAQTFNRLVAILDHSPASVYEPMLSMAVKKLRWIMAAGPVGSKGHPPVQSMADYPLR